MQFLDNNLTKIPRTKTCLVWLLIAGLASAACILGEAWSLALALTCVWEATQVASTAALLSPVFASLICFLACYIMRAAIEFVRATRMTHYAQTRTRELTQQLLERIYDTGTPLVQQRGSGSLITTLIEGTSTVQTYLELILPKTADVIAIPTALCIGLFCIDWISGIIALCMLPFMGLYMKFLGLNAKQAAAKQHGRYVRLANYFTNILRGITTLKLFGRSASYEERVYRASEELRCASLETIKVATLSSLVIDLFRTFALAAIAIMLGFRLLNGTVALAPALATLIIVPEFFGAIRRFSTDFHASLEGKNQLCAIFEVLHDDAAEATCSENVDGDEATCATSFDGANSIADNASGAEGAPLSLELAQVSFSYRELEGTNSSRRDALTDVNLSVQAPCRVGIIGASGAGKSTLARILAGFDSSYGCTSGRFGINGVETETLTHTAWQRRVMYIPQNPHIFSASLRDNVRFYCPDARDEAVFYALGQAGLAELLRELPHGLDTMIGAGGRQLSGGQAQRIALARAFLDTSRDVLVFDEPTAHLDIETEIALKDTMLALMEGKLVFFATHRRHWLHDMDIVMELEDGHVVRVYECEQQKRETRQAEVTLSAGRAPEAAKQAPSDTSSMPAPAPAPAYDISERKANANDSDTGRFERVIKNDTWVKPFFKQNKRTLYASIGLGLAALVFACALMFTSGYLISLSAEEPDIGVYALFVPLAFVQIFGLGKPFLSYFERLKSHDWVLSMTSKLRRRLYHAIEKSDYLTLSRLHLGDMLGLLSEDIDHIQNLYLRCVLPAVTALIIWLGASIFLGCFTPLVGLCALAYLALYVLVVPLVAVKHHATYSARAKSYVRTLYAKATDAILGIADWNFSGRRSDFVSQIMTEQANIHAANATLSRSSQRRTFVLQALFGAFVCAIFAWAAVHFCADATSHVVAGAGAINRASDWIAAFVLGLFPLLEAFLPVSDAAVNATAYIDSIERLNDAEQNAEATRADAKQDAKAALPNADQGAETTSCATKPDSSSKSRLQDVEVESERNLAAYAATSNLIPAYAPAVSLQQILFAYEANKPVLRSLSLDIKPGEKLAILGSSGAGKSTLAALIRGDLEPQAGKIERHLGTHLNECSLQVGTIQQDTYLFNMTLLGNLRMGDTSITKKAAEEALRAVGLEGLLARLPKGIDTVVDEAGLRFSGGERHRIALARVLLRNTPLVLLDEPMAALDPETERALLETILHVFVDRTVVIITHHLLGAELFDRLVFIDNGRVSLEGSHAQLTAKSDYYNKLLEYEA